jgi:predicted Zn-dependent protease
MSHFFSALSRRFRHLWYYPFLVFLMAAGIFVGSTQITQAIPWFDILRQGVQVIQLSTISDSQEVELGKQINQQLVSKEIKLYRNPQIERYVNQIGQRLVKSSDRANIPYTFQVVNNSVNAFATMGGFVYLHTGLLRFAENEAQLASVIAHEIGHIAERHALQQMRQTAIARGVATAAGLDRSAAVNIGVEIALRRPNSRQAEFEADASGLQALTKAGYAPIAMVNFMDKIRSQSSSVPAFLSTHPAPDDRIARLRKALPQPADVGNGLNNAAYRQQIRPLG